MSKAVSIAVPSTVSGLSIVGVGEAVTAKPAEFSRNAASFFADPAAWLVVAAAERALDACAEPVRERPDGVGVIVASGQCTALTMSAIAGTAARGMVSPLRFAGANPGVLAGLPCITWKLRGPTIVLTMDPAHAAEPAVTVATAWLRGGQARHVLLATYEVADGEHIARCLIVRAGGADEPDAGDVVIRLLTSAAGDHAAGTPTGAGAAVR